MRSNAFLLIGAVTGLSLATACKDKVAVEELGSYTTDTGGLTGDIAFDIPDETLSALFWCGPYGDDTLATAWTITDASDGTWYSYENSDSYAMRVGNHDDFLPVLMPVSPDANISPGTWAVNVWIPTEGKPTTVECGAVYRTGSASNSATVDLKFILVGLNDVDASSAAGDADLQTVVQTMTSTWAGVGLEVGSVSYEDFSGNTDKYAVLDISEDDTSELNALFREVEDDGAQVLNIFLVQEISSDSGSTVFGLAAGPPGAATMGGTSKSGMVLGALDLRDSPDFLALVAAHEGAHFMGLFHTSEKDGATHDPLSDTAECDASMDSDGSGRVEADECGTAGENVMFWSPEAGTTTLSDDQGWVLRRNPAAQ